MDEVELARRAATAAVADVEPPPLRARVTDFLDASSMLPGILVVRCARSLDGQRELVLDERAAGVQLIYEGLRLTRTLAHTEPWADRSDHREANIDILAADVMVARGFYLLARTAAAGKAVETVRAFGRDQTHRRANPEQPANYDRRLESDVFELAAIAGASAAGGAAPDGLRRSMAEIGQGVDPADSPDIDAVLTHVGDALDGISAGDLGTGAGDPLSKSTPDS